MPDDLLDVIDEFIEPEGELAHLIEPCHMEPLGEISLPSGHVFKHDGHLAHRQRKALHEQTGIDECHERCLDKEKYESELHGSKVESGCNGQIYSTEEESYRGNGDQEYCGKELLVEAHMKQSYIFIQDPLHVASHVE